MKSTRSKTGAMEKESEEVDLNQLGGDVGGDIIEKMLQKLTPTEREEWNLGRNGGLETRDLNVFGDWLCRKATSYQNAYESLQEHVERPYRAKTHETIGSVINITSSCHEKKSCGQKCQNGEVMNAARALWRLANCHSSAICLAQRIEYLSCSIVCARAAESSFQSIQNAAQAQFLCQLEEEMEEAKLQSQVLDAVSQLPPHTTGVSEAISRLNADLLDVTQLYDEFAEPLDLWECKLAILDCADHSDAALVVNVWTDIILSELKKLGRADSETKLMSLGNKIRTLARSYAASDQLFPLDFLIKTLEIYSIQWNAHPGWVVSILVDSGLGLVHLFAAYNKLYNAKDPVWRTEGKPYHVLEVLYEILKRMTEPSTLGPSEQRNVGAQGADAISIYLTDLYRTARSTFDFDRTASLITECHNLQFSLMRIEASIERLTDSLSLLTGALN